MREAELAVRHIPDGDGNDDRLASFVHSLRRLLADKPSLSPLFSLSTSVLVSPASSPAGWLAGRARATGRREPQPTAIIKHHGASARGRGDLARRCGGHGACRGLCWAAGAFLATARSAAVDHLHALHRIVYYSAGWDQMKI